MGSIDNTRIELDMYETIIENSNIIPTNIIEIGSQNGWDSNRLANRFNIHDDNVYILEAHPGFYHTITTEYPNYNVYNLAGSDTNGVVTFNAAKNFDDGRSSFLDRDIYTSKDFIKVDIESTRMDTFLTNHSIDSIDLLKIDVEGATYQVLNGFGHKLGDIKSIGSRITAVLE